ncbi:t-snare proteins protein [Dioscorea alata]|uniref:T-snare proteins protein n=2 Tax=Dioscorea alata TaxID=55571 RepID=A0ACB7VDJ2_DIOAL|nr:t-snare proteins protein [Dioscorea alata]KAH7671747.1 t-snare proteins protein [Dioscorea alata]
MASGNSFDLWQKDVFFSAAEEVQESADTMESMYRMWLRSHSDGFSFDDSNDLRRDLHAALGTAKWQLEAFERAVGLSHQSLSSEDAAISRRQQFIDTIKNQISCLEKALSDSHIEGRKHPFWLVQLDEEERDDLAAFLSSDTRTLHESKVGKHVKHAEEVLPAQVEMPNGQKTTSCSPDVDSWKILIADDEDAKPMPCSRPSSLRGFIRNVGSATRSNWFRNSFPKVKSELDHQSKPGAIDLRGISRFAQHGMNSLTDRGRSCLSNCRTDSKASDAQQFVGKFSGLRRHIEGSYGRSFQILLLLLLSIFLIVPIVFY